MKKVIYSTCKVDSIRMKEIEEEIRTKELKDIIILWETEKHDFFSRGYDPIFESISGRNQMYSSKWYPAEEFDLALKGEEPSPFRYLVIWDCDGHDPFELFRHKEDALLWIEELLMNRNVISSSIKLFYAPKGINLLRLKLDRR